MTDYNVGDTLYKRFTTRAFASGAPTVLAGTPVVSNYEDDSVTQITAGITLGVDHDSVVGLNLLTMVATAANGYEAGKSYDAVITVGTVGGVSVVGEVVWSFRLRSTKELLDLYEGPQGPGVFMDSGAGNTNTVTGTDGIWGNPVSTAAAARTIADDLGITQYYLVGNADITLAATHVDWSFVGIGEITSNILNLGSQDVSRSQFYNVAIEGTQGGAGRILANDCALQDPGAGATTLHIFACRCGIVDSIEIDTSNDNVFDQCYSLVAGTSAPVIVATGAAGTVSVRHFSGGIEFESLSASHNVSVEEIGQIIFNANCNVNATVALRGIGTITDNAGMNNLSQDAFINMSKINAEMDTALTDIGLDHLLSAAVTGADVTDNSVIASLAASGATADWDTFDNQSDSLEAIRDGVTAIPTTPMRGTDGANTTAPDNAGIADIQSRLPAALVNSRMDATVDGTGMEAAAAQVVADLIIPKTNTALSNIEFLMVDETDFTTPETGLTVAGTRSIDGGAFGAVTGVIAEVANGIYQLDASQADMNGSIITFRFTSAGAADRFLTIRTSG